MKKLLSIILLAVTSFTASAAPWSDTSVALRVGNTFSEPYNTKDVHKDILSLTHVSGYSLGSNFVTADFLISDANDPAGAGSSNGAQEVYVVYRNTVDFNKYTGMKLNFGPFKGINLVSGFDLNTKTDAGYNSKKRMLVAGVGLPVAIPFGFAEVNLLSLWESNAPFNTYSGVSTSRYAYAPHPMLNVVWGIPVTGDVVFSGFANFIAPKGKDEFGNDTATETNIDTQLMYKVTPNFLAGVQYQWWRNKFGNDANGPAGQGANASTWMLRTEYHF